LVEHGVVDNNNVAIKEAIKNGHLDVVKFLKQVGNIYSKDYTVLEYAIKHGRADIVKYLTTIN
jgi:ankyrin repeat protein